MNRTWTDGDYFISFAEPGEVPPAGQVIARIDGTFEAQVTQSEDGIKSARSLGTLSTVDAAKAAVEAALQP